MRPGEDPRRRVIGSDIGEEAEKEQSAATGAVVHLPVAAFLTLEARVDVPASIAWVHVAREPHDERSEIRAFHPSLWVEQLVDRREQPGCVGGPSSSVAFHETTHHGPSPACRVGVVNTELVDREVLALQREVPRERGTQANVALFRKLPDLVGAQHGAMLTRHRSSCHSFRPWRVVAASAADDQLRGIIGPGRC